MREELNAALKDAQKSQDNTRVCTLRLINAAVKDRDIAARGAGKDPISDADITEIMAKMMKQRHESAAIYEEGGRLDLAEQERRESAVIAEFLPEQLCEDSVKQACAKIVKTTGAEGLRDMGKCMNALKEQYPGQMDFAKASGIVKSLLR
ncbi:MAG: GatB/YqeY domain-containing protein [Ahrensia sp.]|nr:GatB/YqeY domain-containing protein [Ahrensia sp.]